MPSEDAFACVYVCEHTPTFPGDPSRPTWPSCWRCCLHTVRTGGAKSRAPRSFQTRLRLQNRFGRHAGVSPRRALAALASWTSPWGPFPGQEGWVFLPSAPSGFPGVPPCTTDAPCVSHARAHTSLCTHRCVCKPATRPPLPVSRRTEPPPLWVHRTAPRSQTAPRWDQV